MLQGWQEDKPVDLGMCHGHNLQDDLWKACSSPKTPLSLNSVCNFWPKSAIFWDSVITPIADLHGLNIWARLSQGTGITSQHHTNDVFFSLIELYSSTCSGMICFRLWGMKLFLFGQGSRKMMQSKKNEIIFRLKEEKPSQRSTFFHDILTGMEEHDIGGRRQLERLYRSESVHWKQSELLFSRSASVYTLMNRLKW